MKPVFQSMVVRRMRCAVVSAAVVALVGCASPTVVQTIKPGDSGLTCPQLFNEYSDTDRFLSEAEGEKSFTSANVARLLFFWPALVGTSLNADEAISAAKTRKRYLANLMKGKNCQIPLDILADSLAR